MGRAAGFSLLELFIVLVIVLLLGSMYWSFGSGNDSRQKQKSCQKNLQKVFIALEIFANDHAGKYPEVTGAKTSGAVLDLLVPRYTVDTSSFICPASKDAPPPAGESLAKRTISYAYFMGRQRRDAQEGLMSDRQIDSLAKTAGQFAFSTNGQAPGNNHQKSGGNVLFGDGHVETTPARLPFSLVLPPGVVLLNP